MFFVRVGVRLYVRYGNLADGIKKVNTDHFGSPGGQETLIVEFI